MSEEKWIRKGEYITTDEPDSDAEYIGKVYRIDRANRVVEEHNALAGIDDVELFMAEIFSSLGQIAWHSQRSSRRNSESIMTICNQALALFPTTPEKKDI